jgi:hypothetical protein
MKHFIPLVNRHFFVGSLPNTARNVCSVTAESDLWNHSKLLGFHTWDAILTPVIIALYVESVCKSNGTNYKLDYITDSNAFSFHSSAFWFISSITVKWYVLHVYALYITTNEYRHKNFATASKEGDLSEFYELLAFPEPLSGSKTW